MADPTLAHRFREDPEAVLDRYDLTEAERETLVAGDQNDVADLVSGDDSPTAAYRDRIA
jgi:hypothetical protein